MAFGCSQSRAFPADLGDLGTPRPPAVLALLLLAYYSGHGPPWLTGLVP